MDKMLNWLGRNITTLITCLIIVIGFALALNIQAGENKKDIESNKLSILDCSKKAQEVTIKVTKDISEIKTAQKFIQKDIEKLEDNSRAIRKDINEILLRLPRLP